MRTGISLTLATLALLASADPARAYRTAADLPEFEGAGRIAWAQREVPYQLHPEMPAGVALDEFRNEVSAAARTLRSVSCADLSLEDNGLAENLAASGDDRNTIQFVVAGWEARGFEPNAAATTDIRYRIAASGTSIIEADIFLNAEHFAWGINARASGVRDVRAVVTHELLHFVGLLHPCELDGNPPCRPEHRETSLYPHYLGLRQRVLARDDIDGVCALYPACIAEELGCVPGDPGVPDVECFTDVDCETTAWCHRGSCTSRGQPGDVCTTDDECVEICNPRGLCAPTCREHRDCPMWWSCVAGVCDTTARSYGDRCGTGRSCASNLCATEAQRLPEGWCTRRCGDDAPCPVGDVCEAVEDAAVCLPPRGGRSGCSAAGGRANLPGLLAMLAVWARKRRRS